MPFTLQIRRYDRLHAADGNDKFYAGLLFTDSAAPSRVVGRLHYGRRTQNGVLSPVFSGPAAERSVYAKLRQKTATYEEVLATTIALPTGWNPLTVTAEQMKELTWTAWTAATAPAATAAAQCSLSSTLPREVVVLPYLVDHLPSHALIAQTWPALWNQLPSVNAIGPRHEVLTFAFVPTSVASWLRRYYPMAGIVGPWKVETAPALESDSEITLKTAASLWEPLSGGAIADFATAYATAQAITA